jgi:molybdate transport system substrate-binding protein
LAAFRDRGSPNLAKSGDRVLNFLMKFSRLPALVWTLALAAFATPGSAQAETIRVLSPGVVLNAGLLDLAASFTRMTGVKVFVLPDVMGKIVNDIKTKDPAPDVIFLPMDLMASLALDGGTVPDSFTPLGRVEIGLAVKSGAPHPDISTVGQLIRVLRSAQAVMVSNPEGGMSLEAGMIERLLRRPDFAGIHAVAAKDREGGQALAAGEGDMALQLVCEIYPHKEISLVGPLPHELGAYIDNAVAVTAKSRNVTEARAFISYITRPEAAAVWKAKGLDRF